MADVDVATLLENGRVNAVLAWAITAGILLTAVGTGLTGDLAWGAFAAAVGALALLPPVAFRDRGMMLSWEVLALAGLPVLGRSVATLAVTTGLGTYLSVAALALVVAVELHTFTAVSMSSTFAVGFVTVTTMAVAGVWAVARWVADRWLGTELLLNPRLTEAAVERGLMLEFLAATVAGLLAGLVFEWYVRRRARVDRRVPSGRDGRRERETGGEQA